MKSTLQSICHQYGLVLLDVKSVSGGDINQAFQLKTNSRKVFIKLNEAERLPGMLQSEAGGLDLLKQGQTFRIPALIGCGIESGYQYLMLEWIDSGRPGKTFWEDFAAQLVQLHKHTQPKYGLSFDNYIGSLPQHNTPKNSFTEFYAENRILPLVKILYDLSHFSKTVIQTFENVCKKLADLFPEEVPALLHGDLWAGNYLVDTDGNPVLMDAAPYYGHRELDVAMMKLFGGFDERVFQVYKDQFPLAPGWEKRVSLWQLYPNLVHGVLFGGHYIQKSLEIARTYTE